MNTQWTTTNLSMLVFYVDAESRVAEAPFNGTFPNKLRVILETTVPNLLRAPFHSPKPREGIKFKSFWLGQHEWQRNVDHSVSKQYENCGLILVDENLATSNVEEWGLRARGSFLARNTKFKERKSNGIFLSYTAADSELALEIKRIVELTGVSCFMAEKDIPTAEMWEPRIREALLDSDRLLLLLTPRSINRPWVHIETGAAWILEMPIIPALFKVSPADLNDLIKRFQTKLIDTPTQRAELVRELAEGQLLP